MKEVANAVTATAHWDALLHFLNSPLDRAVLREAGIKPADLVSKPVCGWKAMAHSVGIN